MPLKNQQGSANPNWKGGKIETLCPTCGELFEHWPSWKARYCSMDCYPKSGENNPKWRGGFLINDGYKYIYNPRHPDATKTGYVLEHRLVMEKVIGRRLEQDELVHHLNHNRLDNRPENLHLCSNSEHGTTHIQDRARDEKGRLLPCEICRDI